jgi:hypothetical protein
MINKDGCIDYITFISILPSMKIEDLEFLIKCIKGSKDEEIIKSYLRDKKIQKILES